MLKLRLAMALHQTAAKVCDCHDVRMAWQAAGIDASWLPTHAGWSENAVGTIDFYRGQNARLTLPPWPSTRLCCRNGSMKSASRYQTTSSASDAR